MKTDNDAEAVSQQRAAGEKHRIRLPDGATSLIDQVRLGMATGFIGAEAQAKYAGLSRDTYNFTRKLLLLKARQILNEVDERVVNHALKVLNEDLLVTPAKKIAAPVLRKYWISNTVTGQYRGEVNSRTPNKVRKRFDNTLFAIREACTNNDELKIPLLSRTEKEEVGHSLKEAIDALVNLRLRIMGDNSDQ